MEYAGYTKKSNFLDFSGQWECFNEEDKDSFGNYSSLEYSNCFSRDNILSSIDLCVRKNFITTFLFSIIENKNNKYHFHIILSIKNFIDYNYTIKKNLYNNLLTQLQEDYFELDWDIKVDSLLYYKDIKNWIMYMHKEIKTWHNKSLLCVDDNSFIKPFINELIYIYNCLITPTHSLDVFGVYTDHFWKEKKIKINVNTLYGIKITFNKIDQRTLINILQYFLILNNYYLYNNYIYEKIENTYISYIEIGTIDKFLYEKFQENVIKFYITYFNAYFDGFDFNYLLTNYFIKSKNLIIESLKDITTNKIELDFSLMEFTDGVYSIKDNKFLPKDSIKKIYTHKSTIKYYNKTYDWVRKNKPTNWISGLCYALNIENKETITNINFTSVCISIANIFQQNKDKKSTLFVYGESNTGKTSLIVKPLENYFGVNNIGSIISAKNFKWQDLVEKLVAIVDEGRYNQTMSSDLLKITGQETIIVEKKYSKDHAEIKPIPVFILSNSLFEDKNKEINKALSSRMIIVEFSTTLPLKKLKNAHTFKNNIKEEEPNIIIFCNKIFFKKKQKIKQISKVT